MPNVNVHEQVEMYQFQIVPAPNSTNASTTTKACKYSS